MSLEQRIEKLKLAFNLGEIKTEKATEGLFAQKIVKYHIPQENFKQALDNFPVLQRAVKAGLFKRDRITKTFVISSETLKTNPTDKRKFNAKQFFSLDGKDKNERSTAYDLIYTIENISKLANKLNLDPKDINYSIRHKDGDPDEVMNFIELDPKLFGENEKEIQKNIEKINKLMCA